MIRVSQTFDFRRGLDVVARNHELRTPQFILSLDHLRGTMFDYHSNAVSPRSLQWIELHINLRGRVRLEVEGNASEHERGTVFVGHGVSSVCLRSSPPSLSHEVLTLVMPAPEKREAKLAYVDRAPPALLQLAQILAEQLQNVDESEAAVVSALQKFLACLGAWGVSAFPTELVMEALARPVPAADKRLAQVFADVMTKLDQNPALSDIAAGMGLGERQTHRRIQALLGRYYATQASWASCVAASRLSTAIVLSSHPDANLETVAKLAGYRRATSLCHAFSDAGLRSPAAIGRALRSGEALRAVATASLTPAA